VRVDVESPRATIDAPDLTRDGDAYVNDAYGVSGVTLRIDIEPAVVEINLELAE